MVMKSCVLLLSALLAQDSDHRVRELVAALDDDSIETREKASSNLLAAGEAAIPALRAALESPQGAETKGRIADLLQRLDAGRCRREFQGGEIANGLCAALRLREDGPSALVVQVEIMNVGGETRPICPIRWWDLDLPADRFVSNLSLGRLSVTPLSGQAPQNPKRRRL